MSEKRPLTESASQLQEAIDTLVQSFEYPASMSIEYAVDDGTKRTVFTVETADETAKYEVVYDGATDEAEPELSRLE